MKKIAIVYFSYHGQTQKIAEEMGDRFKNIFGREAKVTLIEISKERPWHPFPLQADAVIIGAPVQMTRFPRPLLKWIRRHLSSLQNCETAFFSVSLNAANASESARSKNLEIFHRMVESTGWSPGANAFFAGSLAYPEYGWFMRRVMKRISAAAGGPTDTTRSHELTDWSQVNDFVGQIARKIDSLPAASVS